jgi:two-component system nitrate/nitrite response regulator NarL
MMNIRIAVVDDHPLFREGVIRSLNECPGLDIIAEGGSKQDAITIVERDKPDLLLLDISMPGNGLEAVGEVLERQPDTKIIILTVSETNEDLARAIRLGAKGYILKGVGAQELADVVKTVAEGQTYIAPSLSLRLVESLSRTKVKSVDPLAELTPREADVLSLVASGLSNKRIAIALDLHEKTIKHHMTRIFAKLNVSNRTEAALALRDAHQHGASTERTQTGSI